eukprot:scaffold240595_cov63-Attheya_sp.AAC.4
MFLDFNHKILFEAQQHLVERPARTLSTKNKLGARQYRKHGSTKIISNNILKRALAIEEDAKMGFTNELKIELEKVDADLNKILLESEGQIATHSYIPWSPELHQAYVVWKYWFIRLSNLKTKRISSKRAKQLLERLSNQHEVLQGDSKCSVSGQLRKAR